MSAQGGGNGPRTHELVEEVRAIENRVRDRGLEIDNRLTELETKMRTIGYLGGLLGTFVVSVSVLVFVGVLNP